MGTSGSVIGRTLRFPSSSPSSARNCSTCDANPPIEPSSTVTSAPWFFARSRTSSVSSGLQNRASATVTLTPISRSVAAASRHRLVHVPYPRSATSVPLSRIRPLPMGSTWPSRPGSAKTTPSASMSTPTPAPRGYRKHDGPSSYASDVAIMWHSSASLDGAITTMSGRHAMNVTSYAPACVGPSSPTSPARSMANRTGSFCSATSCTTWSHPL